MICKVCAHEIKHDGSGRTVDEAYWFQIIEGEARLAREFVLHTPAFIVHKRCIEALRV